MKHSISTYIKPIPWKSLTGFPTFKGIRAGAPASWSSIILLISILYIASFSFDSPLRYSLSVIHCAALIYLRDVSIIIAILLEILKSLERKRIPKGMLIVFAIISIHFCIGLLVSRNVAQTLFGLKVLLPFVAGTFAATYLSKTQNAIMGKAFLYLWMATIAGLFLEKSGLKFPWSGFTVGFGDIVVQGNRNWTSVGISRLSGFTRASFDAAIITSTLPFFFMYSFRRSIRILIILISIAAITWTITKGVFLGFLIASIASVILEFKFPFRRAVSISVIIAGFALMITLPLYFEGKTFYTDRSDLVQEFLLGSFRERINYTWPDAWTYLQEPLTGIMGVGIGGIGVAQSYFGNSFQPGDNMFVYLRVVFGIPAYLYLGYALKKAAKFSSFAKSSALLIAMYFFFGISMSVIESGVGAFALGFFLSPYSRLLSRPSLNV